MKHFIPILVAGVSVGCVAYTGLINIAHAARPPIEQGTAVGGTFTADVRWTKEGSPYILTNDVFIEGPHTLTIDPGVTIKLSAGRATLPTAVYVTDGVLDVRGSAENRILVEGIDSLRITNGTAHVSHADFRTQGPGIISYWSKVDIASSTFSTLGGGVIFWSSEAEITRTIISDNQAGGIGLFRDAVGRPAGSLSVRDSILTRNGPNSIMNNSSAPVHAENNWWGDSNGPNTQPGNAITGNVIYSPWLHSAPALNFGVPCCSSILFLPGLEASRLYKDDGDASILSMPNRLWEPNRNDDVRKLFLNSDGSSIDKEIYAGKPLGMAFGLVDIYGSFMDFLDSLYKQGIIGEWRSFGYDWRSSVESIVSGDTKRDIGTEQLLQTIQEMAARSKTGKVTLVAHSNGGLVAKYAVKAISDMGKSNIIDSVISVGVPYLGTPQAILGLLHGDNQSIFGGLILKKSVAKELGINMPSAYSLLPSLGYFTEAIGPTIAFASGTSTQVYSKPAQDSFISSRANSALLTAADILHNILDPFVWPASIARWAIAGWGNRTAKGIVYSGDRYSATTTSMGDGTVVSNSASYNAGTTTMVDLREVSNLENRSIDHANMLGSSAIQSIIGGIVSTSSMRNAKNVESAISLIPGAHIGSSGRTGEPVRLMVSTHSPVELHIYDQAGNHTGIAPLPSGMDEDVEPGLFTYIEKNIPGSTFDSYGEDGQAETYISLPENTGQNYKVAINGIGVGEFTYRVERVRGEDVLSTVEYSGLPVTPLMSASSSVASGSLGSSPLSVDVDGDGQVDIVASSTSTLNPSIFFESLRGTVIKLMGQTKESAKIIKRIDRAEKSYIKDKKVRALSSLNRLVTTLGHKRHSSLSASDKDTIVSMISQFIASIE